MAAKKLNFQIPPVLNFHELDEKIIKFWKKNRVFEKSIANRPEDNAYTFYDGPPFVTGTPHYGHLVTSIAKDLIPRYQTMKGKRVRRVWGWDCHGLPIENKVEKLLGLKNRRDIEKLGINKFIAACQKYVENTSSEWEWYVDHIGRWVDFKNAYKTMDLSYMESVIHVFKELYDKKLVYQGKRVSLFCTRCGTPISAFEIAMDNSYAMMKDPSVIIKFRLKDNPQVSLLAWTTTPWTLPANLALAVSPKETYLQVQTKTGDEYLLAQKRVKAVFGTRRLKIVKKLKGQELVGLAYQPLYSFFKTNNKDYHVYPADFVTLDEGTGVVHIAPGFGEEDTNLGKKVGLSLIESVNDEGKFIPAVTPWQGIYIKEADPKIIAELSERSLLFNASTITHSYPYCWRCQTPLIYKAQDSWFIDIQKLKPQLLKTNQAVNWVPKHFKNGRFKQGIENAPDWCISRTRYWATVMPVWQCVKCQKLKVVGSIAEIEKLSGQKVTDLHRRGVDHLTFKCSCGGQMTRVPEVLDVWLDSASMPYGERHYPFQNQQDLEKSFPGDFIVEYTGQVRAWFYVMHVIANALKNSHCFQNVVVTGVMMGDDGRKMSKSYGNYPDPRNTIEKYGADTLRLFLMGGPLMLGGDTNAKFFEKNLEEGIKSVLLILWNTYRYFLTYAQKSGWQYSVKPLPAENILDRWLLARLKSFQKEVETNLQKYHLPPAVNALGPFVNDLSTWYIRSSRDRFANGDKAPLDFLFHALLKFCQISAPVIPFITEEIYQNLENVLPDSPESVHLCDYPLLEKLTKAEKDLLVQMSLVRDLATKAHAQRRENNLKIRQPLTKLTYQAPQKLPDALGTVLTDEVNVQSLVFGGKKKLPAVSLDCQLTDDLRREGESNELARQVQTLRIKQGLAPDDKIDLVSPVIPDLRYQAAFKKRTNVQKIIPGEKLTIKPLNEA